MLVNYDALKQKGEPCRNGKALTLYNKVPVGGINLVRI